MQAKHKAFSTWPGVNLAEAGLDEVGNMVDQLDAKVDALQRLLRAQSDPPPPPSPDEEAPPHDSLH